MPNWKISRNDPLTQSEENNHNLGKVNYRISIFKTILQERFTTGNEYQHINVTDIAILSSKPYDVETLR